MGGEVREFVGDDDDAVKVGRYVGRKDDKFGSSGAIV